MSIFDDFPYSFSPSDGGFHDHQITPEDLLPDDVIGVSAEDYADLIEQRDQGKIIRVADGALAAVEAPASDSDPAAGINAALAALEMRKRVGPNPILAAGAGAYPSIDFWSDGRSSADFVIRSDDDRAMTIDTHENDGVFKFFADGNIGTAALGDLLQRFLTIESQLQEMEIPGRIPVGYHQDWVDVTDERAVVTQYENRTGRPIQVAISELEIASSDTRPGVFLKKPGTSTWLKIASAGNNMGLNAAFIVPTGYTYAARSNGVSFTAGSFKFTKWMELR